MWKDENDGEGFPYAAPSSDRRVETTAAGVNRVECGVRSGGQQFPSLGEGEEICDP